MTSPAVSLEKAASPASPATSPAAFPGDSLEEFLAESQAEFPEYNPEDYPSDCSSVSPLISSLASPACSPPAASPSDINLDDIPELFTVSTGASIFVPIDDDLLAPIEPPATRPDRLRAILAQLDGHAARVRQNLVDLLEREGDRIALSGQLQQANVNAERAGLGLPPLADPLRGAPNDVVDDMIACMSAPPPLDDPRWTDNITDIPSPDDHGRVPSTPREWALLMTLDLMMLSLGNLANFDAHVKKIREVYERALERELERDAS